MLDSPLGICLQLHPSSLNRPAPTGGAGWPVAPAGLASSALRWGAARRRKSRPVARPLTNGRR